jgi:hypothetical protein
MLVNDDHDEDLRGIGDRETTTTDLDTFKAARLAEPPFGIAQPGLACHVPHLKATERQDVGIRSREVAVHADLTDRLGLLRPRGRPVLHHGGTIDGGRAMLMMFPESKVVIAMLSNLLAEFGEQEAQRIGALFVTN